MASISNDGQGLRRIQFVINSQRKAIRLGHCTAKQASTICTHIEAILSAKLSNSAVEPATAQWLGEIPDDMHQRLAAAGLVQARLPKGPIAIAPLGTFFDKLIGQIIGKPNTVINMKQTRRVAIGYFGENRDMATITVSDAKDFQKHMADSGFAEATYRRHLGRCRQLFHAAIESEVLGKNPFASKSIKVSVGGNDARKFNVTREMADKLIAACPDGQWRLMVALSRYGGIRTPSETFLLKWADVNWETNRVVIHSPKTEHQGKPYRVIPLWPELKQPLMDCFEQAEPGQEFCITRYRDTTQNLRTQLERIIKRAGLKPWPKLWHNMRASRQTELAQTWPLHIVCEWIGNSKAIAQEHYLTVTDADYARAASTIQPSPASPETAPKQAAHNAAQYGAETARKAPQGDNADDEETGNLLGFAEVCSNVHECPIPPTGFEPVYAD